MEKKSNINVRLSFGINCKDSSAPLVSVTPMELFTKVVDGTEHDLISSTKNLRSVLKYSRERYRIMKTGLPFFSCSEFSPAVRGIQNFVQAFGLVIDIDLMQEITTEFITRLKEDPRVAMGYISPSKCGVKLLFIFDQPVSDAGSYIRFYKNFTHSFSSRYHIADAIDKKNCDVSRISFICHDPDAWYNKNYEPLDTSEIKDEILLAPVINLDDSALSGAEISAASYRRILSLLDTRPKIPKVQVPIEEEITKILPGIEQEFESYGIQIKSSESIQYGAKLKLLQGRKTGEVNIYHGKRGFSVVSSPRKGTDQVLNEAARHILEGFLTRF